VKKKEYSRASGSYPRRPTSKPSSGYPPPPLLPPPTYGGSRNLIVKKNPPDKPPISLRESNALRNYHRNQGNDNLEALVFKQAKGKAWKSAQDSLLVITSTISRDDTAGEVVRQAKLLAHFGQKRRSNASIWRGGEDLREPGGTTVEGQQPPPTATEDIHDLDDVGSRNFPPLRPMKITFRPSPPLPPVEALPLISPESVLNPRIA
jgi:hypothetical protein